MHHIFEPILMANILTKIGPNSTWREIGGLLGLR